MASDSGHGLSAVEVVLIERGIIPGESLDFLESAVVRVGKSVIAKGNGGLLELLPVERLS